MVLELTNNKRIDATLLESVMVEIEKSASVQQTTTGQPTDFMEETTSTESLAFSSRETENLLELIGKILQRVLIYSIMSFS